MPKHYQYQGKHYQLPDGLTNDEALAKIRAHLGESPAGPGAAPAPEPQGHWLSRLVTGAAKQIPSTVMDAAEFSQRPVEAGVGALAERLGLGGAARKARDIRETARYHARAPYQPAEGEGTAGAIGRGITKAAPAVGLAAATAGASVPLQAGAMGTAGAAQTLAEGGTPGEAAVSGALGAGLTALGPVAGKALGGAAIKLKSSAIRLYNKALHPTKEATKELAPKVVPGLIERGVAGNVRKIGKLSDDQVERLGEEINATYKTATKSGTKMSGPDLADALEPLKVPFTAPSEAGEIVILNPGAISALSEIQATLRQLGVTTPSIIWRYRRVVDDLVSSSNGFTRELPRGTAKALQRKAREIFRRELNEAVPDIKAINTEFSFWSNVQKIAKETNRRKTGQQGSMEAFLSMARGGGGAGALGAVLGFAGVGTSTGGTAAALAPIGAVVLPLIRSSTWRTWSAVEKNALADILAGNAQVLQSEAGRRVTSALAAFVTRAQAEATRTADQGRGQTPATGLSPR